MSIPQLSVLMALYNAAPYVRQAVDSVLTQDFGDFELIICDDGSTDDGAQVVADIAAADKRIRVLSNGKNRGYSFTMNRLFEEARGEWIANMDADDLSLPGRFGTMLAFLSKNPEVGIVGSWSEYIDEKDKPLGVRNYFNSPANDDFAIKRRPEWGPILLWPTTFLNRQKLIVENNLRFDDLKFTDTTSHAPDDRFMIRAFGFTKVATTPQKLYAYRRHSNQLTTTKDSDPQRVAKIVHNETMMLANYDIAEVTVVAAWGLWFLRNPSKSFDIANVRRLMVAISKSKRMYEYRHNWRTNPVSFGYINTYLHNVSKLLGKRVALQEATLLFFLTPLTMLLYANRRLNLRPRRRLRTVLKKLFGRGGAR